MYLVLFGNVSRIFVVNCAFGLIAGLSLMWLVYIFGVQKVIGSVWSDVLSQESGRDAGAHARKMMKIHIR